MIKMIFPCLLASLLFLLPELVKISEEKGFKKWWDGCPWKNVTFSIRFITLVVVIAYTVYNEKTAQEKEDSLNARLDDGNKKLLDQRSVIDKQSRYINSLVFNMETSLEGKIRF